MPPIDMCRCCCQYCDDMQNDEYKKQLKSMDVLRNHIFKQIFAELKLPEGSHGLDLGCGVGAPAIMLAETLKPDVFITGVDISHEFIKEAAHNAHKKNLEEHLVFKQGDAYKTGFPDNSFGWLISIDFAGYNMQASEELLKEICRLVKNGGEVILICWSAQQLLPGYPKLEALLNATESGLAPFKEGSQPCEHFLRLPERLAEAGFTEISAEAYTGSTKAPLSTEERNALQSLISMRWQPKQSELGEKDFAVYEEICLPESKSNILNTKGYYCFYTYSVFYAKVSK